MSTQSGIRASEELLTKFKDFLSSDGGRALLVAIDKEQMVPLDVVSGTSSFQDDFPAIRSELRDNEARYILLKLSEPGELAFISFVPDAAPVRSKMLYASSRAALMRELGGSARFHRDLFITELDEVSQQGWKQFEEHENLTAPLTAEEKSLQSVRESETSAHFGTAGQKAQVIVSDHHEMGFPFEEEAEAAVAQLVASNVAGLLQLRLQLPAETVALHSADQLSHHSELKHRIPEDTPLFTVYREPGFTLFVYSCPSGAKVKERMIYATNRKAVVNKLQSMGLEINKEMEAHDGSDLDIGDLIADSQVQAEAKSQSQTPSAHSGSSLRFSRPKGPHRKK